MCDKRVLDVVAEGGCLAVRRSIAFRRSPSRVDEVSASSVGGIEIERANGRRHIPHAKFKAYGISRLQRHHLHVYHCPKTWTGKL